ncbi:hypothetical protein [Agrobacterium tumefaciens]|uniref:hypothetical protein n=1 Tax=Agrobacterium tumefaciens TaxID=358 RepID=UPI001019F35C|nr:hypothetical protein [Agrobacterium tumefaciens]UXS04510.1 hypothetical protein FY156_23910 [Agrobacterium tumefaciens]
MADKKTKKNKTNWIAWGITLVVIYVVAFLLVVGPNDIANFFRSKTSELNNIGDFLAGVFAFPAFVLLATAVLTQRQELSETRDQFDQSQDVIDAQLALIKTQNKFSHRAAQANYKLAIHDKRLSVYLKLKECANKMLSSGTIEEPTHTLIYEALEGATFVFGDDVTKYVAGLRDKSNEFYRADFKLKFLGTKQRNATITEAQKKEVDKLIDDMTDIERWFLENMTFQILEEKFASSLRLPEDIALEDSGTTKTP